jgi:glycosyltransferase involved in cell wall biosynthesis
MRKKVLIVSISLYNGGAEKSLVNMLNEMPQDRYDIDLLLFRKEGMFLPQVPKWVNILDTPDDLRKLYAPLSKSGNRFFTKLVGTVAARIKESVRGKREGYRWKRFYSKKIGKLVQKYDVAIAYTSGEAMFFVGDKVDAGKKIVWIHNDFRSANYPKEYCYDYYKNMELVTISEECARIVEQEFSDLHKKVYSIANITSSVVTRKRAEEFYPKEFDKNDLNIVSVGRLMKQKGFDYAIEAAAVLRERGLDFKWYIIGDGDLKKKLQAMIKERKLDDCFYLIGARDNPYPYMKNCDIFAQTSRFEGKSVVLDEAKIVGAPILVTKYPTVFDQIEDQKEGCIVEIDPGAIADGIEKMIREPELRRSLKEYLLAHDYGNQHEISKYIEVIDA